MKISDESCRVPASSNSPAKLPSVQHLQNRHESSSFSILKIADRRESRLLWSIFGCYLTGLVPLRHRSSSTSAWFRQVVVDQLAASGNNISDKEKMQQTLNGLGHDYHAFIIALEVLPVLSSFNELQGKLLQHEMNMKRVIERTDQGNSQNVLAMNVKFGKSHENSNHGGRGILPTPHNQAIK
ncbi:hypothetical protein EJ110_NYTH44312 [Nymphaea thermarum]|nr:hypothetical protein EJ110_NYTH44312 [Nymphaea thermarum]